MFFEGAEKKLEVVLSATSPSLFEKDRSFWEELVAKSKATILSELSGPNLKSFLLSESSLFVWKDRILMVTCGQTSLVDAVLFLLRELGKENVDCLFFQRKNEYRAQMQPTSFLDDVKLLREVVDGTAMRFGRLHSNHNLIFHSNKAYRPQVDDTTVEFLIYDLSEQASAFLTGSGLSKQEIRDFFALEKVLPGFEIDDFVFRPYGYSLNAVNDDDYYTIHVTPQQRSPYMSFETSLPITKAEQGILNHFLEILSPGAFDLMTFNCPTTFDFTHQDYIQVVHSKEKLSIGYDIHFRSFYKRQGQPEKPYQYLE
jgi:S-adenosylmethionine decarboxylase